MQVQEKLMLEQVKNMPPLNRQMYSMVKSIGSGYKASAMQLDAAGVINNAAQKQEMAEIINGTTNNVAFSFGLSDPQKLKQKLEDIKKELLASSKSGVVTKGDLKKRLEEILKTRLRNAFEKAGLAPELVEELEDREIEEDRKQDQDQNQDLFILTANGNGERIIDREEEQRDLQDRQRQIAEKSLRVLEAMEKARDAIEKGKEIPEMDLSYLKDLTPQEFAKQMAVFKTFGLQPVALGRDRQVREDPEREVTLETVTKEDIEQGDVAFAIQFDKLKGPNWRKMAEKSKAFFEQKGLKTKYIPETTIEDDLINAVAGTDKTQQAGQRKVEDDEGR
ncbi:MAG: hypothetical protein IJW20_03600 [Clostridia bacterium]|nr:hypothetical protein [Clostridia bacterium]